MSGDYRPFEAVEVEARSDGGFQVGYIEPGEWLEYTIQVAEARVYEITIYVASMEGGGQLQFQLADTFSEMVDIPATNSWQTLTAQKTSMSLPRGEHFLRLQVVSAEPFNVDRFEIN